MIPRASARDTARVVGTVLAPMVAQGIIKRRPRILGLTARADTDRRAVRLMQELEERYGPGPLRLRIPGRRIALVLEPDDAERILRESPVPFTPATKEKKAALRQFEPHNVLVSAPADRPERRRFHEHVLDTAHPVHRDADRLLRPIHEEARRLGDDVADTLTYDDFAAAWMRAVRRVVLGDSAADDEELTGLLDALRRAANWSFARPVAARKRDRFLRRVQHYLDRGEPGSLAALAAQVDGDVDVANQVPQWLFAYDAAGMAAYRALVLQARRPVPQTPDALRKQVLESVRLWPTTPVILRDSSTETAWRTGVLPADTALLIVSAYFHRDARRVPTPDEPVPDRWPDDTTHLDGIFPFSAGAGSCPGRNLVLLTTSTFLADLLDRRRLTPTQPRTELPYTLDPFTLTFAASRA